MLAAVAACDAIACSNIMVAVSYFGSSLLATCGVAAGEEAMALEVDGRDDGVAADGMTGIGNPPLLLCPK